jgi:hypothetical protein
MSATTEAARIENMEETTKLVESSDTWDLIASLSKNERVDVYNMFLSLYNDENTLFSEHKYFNVPESGILTILKNKLIHKLCGKVDLESIIQSLETPSEVDKKGGKKLNKSSRQMKTYDDEGEVIISKSSVKAPIKKADKIKEDKLIGDLILNLESLKESELDARYKSNFVEVILFYYLYHTQKSYKDKDMRNFLNSLVSLRNALIFFDSRLGYPFDIIFKSVMKEWTAKIPWKSFLQNHSDLLMKCHFSQYYQSATRPFQEQQEFVDMLKINPLQLFILPWGVGCGKTASLAPVANILWNKFGVQTIYCVPHGPIRDQTAANLYRCGIPFAYIGGESGRFELQPSYHCSYNSSARDSQQPIPTVFIASSSFVKYYIDYWDSYKRLVEDEDLLDAKENPPLISLPKKKRYQHLNHSLWKPKFSLVLDEPNENDQNLSWILERIPQSTFVMSATNTDIVTEEVIQKYLSNHARSGGGVEVIEGKTIGVSTTLYASWLQGEPIISPFTNVKSRDEFATRLERMKKSVLWRRFLSSHVLLDWNDKIRVKDTKLKLDIDFDFETLTYDHISNKIIEWAEIIIDEKMDNQWYEETFGLEGCVPQVKTLEGMLSGLVGKESHKYSGGCILSVPHVPTLYEKLKGQLDGFPEFDEILTRVRKHKEDILKELDDLGKEKKKSSVSTEEKEESGRRNQGLVEQKELKKIAIAGKIWRSVPIPEEKIINTIEHCKTHGVKERVRYCMPLPLSETGDVFEDPKEWDIYCDVVENVDEDIQRLRWKGIGSIIENKQFYMKSIIESDNHYLSYLLVDSLGSYGLNLKISHAILMEDEEKRILPRSVLLQLVGRVGRIGQESTGKVHITSEKIFERLMS